MDCQKKGKTISEEYHPLFHEKMQAETANNRHIEKNSAIANIYFEFCYHQSIHQI